MTELIHDENGKPFGWFYLPPNIPDNQKLAAAREHREEMLARGLYRSGPLAARKEAS
jgi:hypothetical protein